MKTVLSCLLLLAMIPLSTNALNFSCSLSEPAAGLPSGANFVSSPDFTRGSINGQPLRQVSKPGGKFLTDGAFYYWVWAPGDSNPTIAVYRPTGGIYAYYGCTRL